jgi:hypothetical protein
LRGELCGEAGDRQQEREQMVAGDMINAFEEGRIFMAFW